MAPHLQFATTKDGANIAFWAAGEGPVLVQMPAIPWSHCLAEWNDPDWRAWYDRLLQHHRVVRFDPRGCGLSDRTRFDYSLETMQFDLEAVVEKLGLDEFDLIGGSMGGPPAIAYAAAHPDQVRHLLLWCTVAQPADWHAPRLRALTALARADWPLYTETLAHMMAADWDEGSRSARFAAICRQAATLESYEAMVSAFATIDVRGLLSEIRVPTLVMHRTGILVPGVAVAQSLASQIPEAQLALLDGSSTLAFVGDMESVARTIDHFTVGTEALASAPQPPPAAASEADVPRLRIILSSDMSGHTPMMRMLGDDRGRAILREHERITREALRYFDGREVKTFGDGFMASFGSAQRALDCAIAMQREFAASPLLGGGDGDLGLRIGINAGEPIAENGDLFGASVIMATQIAAIAAGGEILVANVVRELAAGKAFLFARRADVFALRSFDDPVRLYELRWAVA